MKPLIRLAHKIACLFGFHEWECSHGAMLVECKHCGKEEINR